MVQWPLACSFAPYYSEKLLHLAQSFQAASHAHLHATFEPRQMLPLSLSYDHRLIDGADAIRFLRWCVEALENPFTLALRG